MVNAFFTHIYRTMGKTERDTKKKEKKIAEKGRGAGSRQVRRAYAMGRSQRATIIALDVTQHNKPAALLSFLIFPFSLFFFVGPFFSRSVAFLWRVSLPRAGGGPVPHAVFLFFLSLPFIRVKSTHVVEFISFLGFFVYEAAANGETNQHTADTIENLREKKNIARKALLARAKKKKSDESERGHKKGTADRQAHAHSKATRQGRE